MRHSSAVGLAIIWDYLCNMIRSSYFYGGGLISLYTEVDVVLVETCRS